MSKTLMRKLKIGTLGLLSVGLLAACNTTDEFERNPDMGPETEEPVEEDVEDPVTDDTGDVEEDAS